MHEEGGQRLRVWDGAILMAGESLGTGKSFLVELPIAVNTNSRFPKWVITTKIHLFHSNLRWPVSAFREAGEGAKEGLDMCHHCSPLRTGAWVVEDSMWAIWTPLLGALSLILSLLPDFKHSRSILAPSRLLSSLATLPTTIHKHTT